MKNYLLSAALLSAVLMGTSCSKEEGANKTETGEATDILVVLESPATRAFNGTEAGVGDENLITSLEFYVFESDGVTVDTEVGTGNGYVKLTDASGLGLTHRIRVTAATGKQMLVVANSNLGDITSGEGIEDIKKRLTTNAFTATPSTTNNPRVIPSGGFEMSGSTTANVSAGNANQVYVTLVRTVAKIEAPQLTNVPVNLEQAMIDQIWDDSFGVTETTTIEFDFTGFAVINGLDKSDISFVGNASGVYKTPQVAGFEWDLWSSNGKARIGSSFTSTSDGTGDYTNNYSGPGANGYFLTAAEGPVYVNESKPTVMNTPGVSGYDPTTVISYIIQGVLTPDQVQAPGAPAVTRYWRVDLTKDEIYHIMRNVVYKVTINTITTPGYSSPEEAEGENPVPSPDETTTDFILSIADWDINEYATDM